MRRLLLLAPLAVFGAQTPSFDNAVAYVRQGNCAGAIEALSPAFQADAKPDAQSYLLMSQCLLQTAGPEPAEKSLRDGLAVHPADAALQRVLGEILMRRRFDNAEAGKLLESASRLAPRDAESRHYYAQWAYMNDRERICAEQEKAALLLPGLNDAARLQMNTLLGMCLGKLEQAPAARAAFQKAEQINNAQPGYDPMAGWQYLQFLSRYGVEADVQALADRILKRVPNFSPALLERAKYLDRSGQPDKAIEQALLTLRSGAADLNVERAAHAILARSYIALGQSENAAREQEWIQSHANPEAPSTANKVR